MMKSSVLLSLAHSSVLMLSSWSSFAHAGTALQKTRQGAAFCLFSIVGSARSEASVAAAAADRAGGDDIKKADFRRSRTLKE
jgi:hypothetical protein